MSEKPTLPCGGQTQDGEGREKGEAQGRLETTERLEEPHLLSKARMEPEGT